VDNQLKSISKIFTQTILRIPDYQRGYAWGTKQLKDFWTDILQLEESKNHYIGVLTFEQVPEDHYRRWKQDEWIINSKCYEPYYVVDGQQRLTTTLILLQAIIESAEKGDVINYFTKEEIVKKYIYDSKPSSIDNSGSYLFGYHEDNPSYEYLKTRIFGRVSESAYREEDTIYTRNLYEAKQFFKDKLAELDQDGINVVFKKITQNFLFNIYSISNEIDVHVAFEGMNNRGKPLSTLELLKNRLIYLSTKFDCEEHERAALRRKINECWKSIYHYLGKNKDIPLDDDTFLFNHFFVHYYDEITDISDDPTIMVDGAVRISKRFFRGDYTTYLLDRKFTLKNIVNPNFKIAEPEDELIPTISMRGVYDYSESLQHSVISWYFIHNPWESENFSDEEIKWLDKLNRIGFQHVSILVMALFYTESFASHRVACLKAIERILFIKSLISSHFFYSLGIEFIELGYELWARKKSVESVTRLLNEECTALVENEEFIKHLRNDYKSSGFYRWPGIKYFLFEYEGSLKDKTKNATSKIDWKEFKREDDDYVTVEHIYPQSEKRKCWSSFDQYTPSKRKLLKNSLGNLLPLSRRKNSSLQDKCFNDKKENDHGMVGFRYGSYSEIQVAGKADWTPSEILKRGLTLLEFMEKRWNIDLGEVDQKKKFLGLDFFVES
jgi:uncharacterized protein with ParB-like and HNH nuclease domain